MKLIYWYAANLQDHNCYSIRARTKREALEEKASRGANDYGEVRKIILEYKDGFDLLEQCTSEGGVLEEGEGGMLEERKGPMGQSDDKDEPNDY